MPMSDSTRVRLGLLEEYRGLLKLSLKKQPIPPMANVPKREQPRNLVREKMKELGIMVSLGR